MSYTKNKTRNVYYSVYYIEILTKYMGTCRDVLGFVGAHET